MSSFFYSNSTSLLRVLIVGVCAYVGLIMLLRIAGKRSLSKLNAFDFVVTVALGSTLASLLLSKDTSLADGLLAFALLVALQYAVTFLSLRIALVDRLVKSEPTLLLHRGQFLHRAMRAERVTADEVLSAIRSQGIGSITEVEAVVLETDGSLSAIRNQQPEAESLEHVSSSCAEGKAAPRDSAPACTESTATT